jgi:hypothetical protein
MKYKLNFSEHSSNQGALEFSKLIYFYFSEHSSNQGALGFTPTFLNTLQIKEL